MNEDKLMSRMKNYKDKIGLGVGKGQPKEEREEGKVSFSVIGKPTRRNYDASRGGGIARGTGKGGMF
jgi:hypothetical protein